MIHPLPPGTRDVLPEEMRELRALTRQLADAFDRAGYGEVWTPMLEYEDVLKRAGPGAGEPGYRLFDESGGVLALRSDATVPIARLVADRYEGVAGPLRFSAMAHAYRAVTRGSGQPAEFLQADIELIGVAGPEGDAEVIALVLTALEEAGLRRHRVGLGDGTLYRSLLEAGGVPEDQWMPLLEALWRRDLVELENRVDGLGLGPAAREVLVALPRLRGGVEVLDRVHGPLDAAVENLRACHELLAERGVADRVIFDLGMLRELGYYTGTIFEVYDPAVAFALGGGGRYDELLGCFGEPRPACGAALDVARVHMAQLAEEGA